MPGFDGTGPAGMGPMTGGGRGYCARPVYGGMPMPFGRGFYGRGGGRGRRNMYYATGLPGWARAGYGYPSYGFGYGPDLSREEESEMLKEEAESLKEELKSVEQRLRAMEEARKQQADG